MLIVSIYVSSQFVVENYSSLYNLTIYAKMRTLAGVAELVDARDLRSRVLWTCGFDSRPRYFSGTSSVG